jgi:hypothetical protein
VHGMLKQRLNPLMCHNVIELHSANYKYLNKLVQTSTEINDIQRLVTQTCIATAYPFIVFQGENAAGYDNPPPPPPSASDMDQSPASLL